MNINTIKRCYKYILTAVLKVQEVFPGSARVQGIQVDNNLISLPGELFKHLKEPGTCV